MACTKGESPRLCSQLCLVGAVVRVRANRILHRHFSSPSWTRHYHTVAPSYRRYLAILCMLYLVDPAKEAHFGHRLSHASVSSGNETANSSLIRSESIWRQPTGFKWIAAATLVLIHAIVSPEVNYGGKVDLIRGTSFDWVTYQLVLRVFT